MADRGCDSDVESDSQRSEVDVDALTCNENMNGSNHNNNNDNEEIYDSESKEQCESRSQSGPIGSAIRGYGNNSRRDRRTRNGVSSSSSSSSSWADSQLMKVYLALRGLVSDFGVPIDVPELAFFGFQSAGKTSILSLLAQWPCGTMKSSIGTRCPVRFELKYDEKARKPSIEIGTGNKKSGYHHVKSYIELNGRIDDHMKALENSGSGFSSDILQVSIASCDVPNLIFIDLPGLMKNDSNSKFRKWKQQIEEITQEIITMKSENNSSLYKYIPVWVQACQDIETASNEDLNIVNALFSRQRPNWKNDVFVVFNKFDVQTDARADELSRYIDCLKKFSFVSKDNFVITSSNPHNKKPRNMTQTQLFDYVQSLFEIESNWWKELVYDRTVGGNPSSVKKLKSHISKHCGLKKMKQSLMDMMCNVVLKTIPILDTRLRMRQLQYSRELDLLRSQLNLHNPTEIRRKVDTFMNEFLSFLNRFQTNKHGLQNGKGEQTFAEEMNDFESSDHYAHYILYRSDMLNTSYSREKEYYKSFYIPTNELANELEYMNQDLLLKDLLAKRIGSGAISRAFNLWTIMIGLMSFPNYSDEYIDNTGRYFDSTRQGYAWDNIRTIVSRSSFLFLDACSWLAEYLRFRLKKNADLVFEHLIHNERAKNGGKIDDKMEDLYYIGVSDYQRFIDRLINEFKGSVRMLPTDLGAILDKSYHESYLNFGTFLLERLTHERLIANFNDNNTTLLQKIQLQEMEQKKFERESKESGNDSNDNESVHGGNNDNHGGKGNRDEKENDNENDNDNESNHSDDSDEDDNESDNSDNSDKSHHSDDSNDSNNSEKKPISHRHTKELKRLSKLNGLNGLNGLNMNEEENKTIDVGFPLPTIASKQMREEAKLFNNLQFIDSQRDHAFVNAVYPPNNKKPFIDIDCRKTYLIKKMCKIYWDFIKHQLIILTISLATNRVLKQVQSDQGEPRKAIQNGVEWPAIQELLNQLSKLTCIDQPSYEQFICERAQKCGKSFKVSVDRMEKEELLNMYGIDGKQIENDYNQLYKESQNFEEKRKEVTKEIQNLKQFNNNNNNSNNDNNDNNIGIGIGIGRPIGIDINISKQN